MKFFAVIFCAFLTACQMAPTKVGESQRREYSTLRDKSSRVLEIGEKTVVLDARPAFDYGLNRVAGSYPFTWEKLAESSETGELLRDPRQAVQRLALLGITPDSPIIVVGSGSDGDAGSGRLAWTLVYLGFSDVQVAGFSALRKYWTQASAPAAQNAPSWTPSVRSALTISRQEFVALAKDAKGRLARRIRVIDVRSPREYLKPVPGALGTLDIGALNIEWKEFFTSEGRPQPALRERLKALDVQPSDRLIVISNRGVRSSAAAYALLALGFENTTNFVGGWRSLQR